MKAAEMKYQVLLSLITDVPKWESVNTYSVWYQRSRLWYLRKVKTVMGQYYFGDTVDAILYWHYFSYLHTTYRYLKIKILNSSSTNLPVKCPQNLFPNFTIILTYTVQHLSTLDFQNSKYLQRDRFLIFLYQEILIFSQTFLHSHISQSRKFFIEMFVMLLKISPLYSVVSN